MWHANNVKLDIIENDFIALSERIDGFAESFFTELFSKHPAIKNFFTGIDAEHSHQGLVSLIDYTISNLQEATALQERFAGIAEIFQTLNVVDEDCSNGKKVFLDTLEEYLSPQVWTEESNISWDALLSGVIELLQVRADKDEPIQHDDSTDCEKESAGSLENPQVDVQADTSEVVVDEEEVNGDEQAVIKNMDSETERHIDVLESSYAMIKHDIDMVFEGFCSKLLERHPELQDLFSGGDIDEKKNKLKSAWQTLVDNLHNSQQIVEQIQEFGEECQNHGVAAGHYDAIQKNLLIAMQESLGSEWTDEIHGAWSRAFTEIIEIILEAYLEPEVEMSNMVNENEVESLEQELEELKLKNNEMSSKIDAIDKVQASIEFNLDGTIITANDNFLHVLGYTLEEIQGKHHSMFVDAEYANSSEYKQFWEKLNRGEFDTGEYKRISKSGKDVWINASYNPVFDNDGNIYKVVKYATDVTDQKLQYADFSGKIAAISKAQAVIEFNLDGTIITANDNFLQTLGYSLDEIQGKHHSMFVDQKYAASHEYKQFWEELNTGQYHEGQFRRINKSGEDVWITASYNPIFDANGKPFKVVKYATDGTELRKQQLSSTRLQSAIDGAQANFMLCDENLNITYVNPSVVEMMRKRQMELRQSWPSLDVDNLVGQNIDQFHKNPGHQRGLLSDPDRLPANSEIKVGDLQFKINATMVIGPDGEYMGNMVEWQDVTEQKKAEDEIKGLIMGASQGDLDLRMRDIEQYEGFMRVLGEGINSLMDSIVDPVKEVMRVLQSLAEGDLTQKMDGDYQGQFAAMRDSANASIDNLFNMVNEIRGSSSNINTSATEIAQGNTDLSSRTEQQASALEETASTVEEMTGTVKQNADNAKQANQLASSARETAEKGGSVVNNAVNAMSEINSSSKKIADIIGVIDEIAFQTNLLALNAAVEAARAGEQGRGFAVVASEVRNLAQRSAAAAKEIKTLINDSVDKVEEGSRLVDESGKTLEEIVTSVKKVSDIIAEIAAAGEEQYVGIEQINKAVGEMDQMTQQNAALVEEAASASQAMSEQSHSLNKMVSVFNVGENGEVSSAAASASMQQERRSPERPWNDNKAHGHATDSTAAAAKPRAAAVGSDDEWEEF